MNAITSQTRAGQTALRSARSSFVTVDWSYPTSINAKKFGHHEGCWTVNVCEPGKDHLRRDCYETNAVKAFTDKGAAIAFADTLPHRRLFAKGGAS